MNFESALAELGALHGVRRVLEIGADYDYYFLKRFRDLGAECVALNIRFDVATPDPYRAWPEKVLADMNVLPFKAGSFDLVLMSATSHHSPDLVRTMREVARVLNADGRALIINDPVGGWLKGLGAMRQVKGPQRHHDIHENEYSLFEYRSAFRRAGLEPRYMFSEYHRQKLSNPARIHPKLRFARLARMLSIPWRVGPVAQLLGRYALLPAHAIFGLPLNVVARKSRPARAERQATSR
jgi:SAM-dependent methyltransferase